MTIPYTYKVVHTDVPAKCMVVEYAAIGYATLQIGMPLPIVGQNIEAIVKQYAPIPQWRDSQLVYSDVPTGTEGSIPPVTTTLEMAKVTKLAEIAAWRYNLEVSGVFVNGVAIRTDRESQSQLASAYTSLKNGLLTSVEWKAADGTFATLGLAQVEGIAAAVASHVQMSFASEKTYVEQVNACTTIAEVDAITLP